MEWKTPLGMLSIVFWKATGTAPGKTRSSPVPVGATLPCQLLALAQKLSPPPPVQVKLPVGVTRSSRTSMARRQRRRTVFSVRANKDRNHRRQVNIAIAWVSRREENEISWGRYMYVF